MEKNYDKKEHVDRKMKLFYSLILAKDIRKDGRINETGRFLG